MNLISKETLTSALSQVSLSFTNADLFKLFSSIEELQPQLWKY